MPLTQASGLLAGWKTQRVIADRGDDSNAVLARVAQLGAGSVIPPTASRLLQREYDKTCNRERHFVECCFNKLKQFRRVLSRFDQRARNCVAFVQFASVTI
jgi:transposase